MLLLHQKNHDKYYDDDGYWMVIIGASCFVWKILACLLISSWVLSFLIFFKKTRACLLKKVSLPVSTKHHTTTTCNSIFSNSSTRPGHSPFRYFTYSVHFFLFSFFLLLASSLLLALLTDCVTTETKYRNKRNVTFWIVKFKS